MPWTKQQQKVIDQRDADILVSAAAVLERRRYW